MGRYLAFAVHLLASSFFYQLRHSDGFIPPLVSRRSGGNGNNNLPPMFLSGHGASDDGVPPSAVLTAPPPLVEETDHMIHSYSSNSTLLLRGGGNPISSTLATLATTLSSPFRTLRRLSPFGSKGTREAKAMRNRIEKLPIERVIVPNSTDLPEDVIQSAIDSSGMIGEPLSNEKVQKLAESLQLWYNRQGYLLHRVVGIQLDPDSATVAIAVMEPRSSKDPVLITALKEMVFDEESGERISMRQYKERQNQRGKPIPTDGLGPQNLNTTLVETKSRVRPRRIAAALGVEPGKPFRFDTNKWDKISQSGLFSQVYQTAPLAKEGGTVQLNIAATEAPSKSLEYGFGKSLYSDVWEGEIDFQNTNLLGGGERLDIVFRRGPTDVIPSVRVRFNDGPLGVSGGYDLEAFRENIPHSQGPLSRQGTTVRVQNPFARKRITNSAAGISIEQTTNGKSLETIASTNMDVGPFVQTLPLNARSNMDASVTVGTRVQRGETEVLPYFTASATTRQLLPLFNRRTRPFVLAFKHSMVTSSDTIPLHVSKSIGAFTRIRGSKHGGEIMSALSGTTELRLPVPLPRRFKQQQDDASIVLFGDWVFANPSTSQNNDNNLPSLNQKSCLGIGLRKSFQGVPLRCDITYSSAKKVKCTAGIGGDFIF